MIGVQQAVAAARDFASDLLDEEKLAGITLEEVELSSDDRFWLVTLGVPAAPGTRDYKVFEVNAQNGRVTSTKIRTMA